MATQYKTIHPVKYYRDFLEHNIRPDGRDLMKYRPITINVDSISTANGSAIVKIGNTTVVCGIKAELAPPRAAEPDSGFIIPNIELTPLCSSKFRPGPPAEEAQIYSQCLYDVITHSGIIDFKELCIAKEKLVWNLFCDLACLDHDGCVLDASLIALVAALKSVKLPQITYNVETAGIKVDENIKTSLNVKSIPIAASFILFDEKLILSDPTADEEQLSSTIVTVVVADSNLCFMHKPGGFPVSAEQLKICMKHSLEKEKNVLLLLKNIFDIKK